MLSLALLAACSSDKEEKRKDDFSSPKALFVDHITSYTGGVVSSASPVMVRLTRNLPDSLISTLENEDLFSFSPSVEGHVSWRDNRTVVFQPKARLDNDKKYEVSLDLKAIINDLDKDKEEFKFVFQTIKQNFELEVGGIKLYDVKDLSKVKVEGLIQTADEVSIDQVKKMIGATQDGKALAITIGDAPSGNAYQFIIEDVGRGNSASEVELEVAGAPIGVDKDVDEDIIIPALDDYKVISSRIVRGADNYISVLFSDPLQSRQNLNGLVTLSNTNNRHRMVSDLNELRIYPTQDISTTIQLTVNSGLKNMAGYNLKEDYTATLRFTQSKPEVKLVENGKGSILPNSDGLKLPFEAVGLKAVDVRVIRVFEDNMLQYLQVNGLGGQRELSRVGKPVAVKTVPLNTSGVTDLNSWNRFTLELSDILKAEAGAFYQIQIGFRKEHSLYFCSQDENIQTLDSELEDEWDAQDESSYWDSYEYYYNSDYNWEERDNPCSNSYYGNRRNVSQMLLASDLGIIAKRADDGPLHVFVTNLISAKPLADAQVKVYDYQQQLIGEGKTDGKGKVSIAPKAKPFAVVVSRQDQTGYLKVDDGSSLSLSNFNVTGNNVQEGLKGFIYGERGVWRPADTVHLALMVEDMGNNLPENHPVAMELYNPNDQLVYRKISSEPIGDIYRFDFVTDADAPTGNWRAKAKVGGASFQKTVKIEAIKPNRLKVALEFDHDRFTSADRTVSGDLNVRWLTGATASGLKAEYEMVLRPVKTSFDKYPNYSFDDESKKFSSEREQVFEGRLNSEGFTKVNIDLGKPDNAPGAWQVNLYGKVYEEGGNFSISNTTIPYYPFSTFVGVKAPEGDKRGILLTDKDHTIKIATVDSEGRPVSRSGLQVKLYKLNWKWWWDNSYDYISNYVGSSYRQPIAKGTISTSNGEGTYKLRVNHPEWGRYYLQVEDPQSGHSAGQVVYLDWPGWAGKGKRGELDGATMLDFAVEKEEYRVGEQIRLSIPSTKGNRVLVSLESGSEVIETFWVETEADNTSIAFEATPEMAPNVYAHLTMIQPHGQTANDLPIRLYGVSSIKVVDPGTKLQPVIAMPAELRPEQKFEVKVSEQSGKAMAYTIAMVDEGLLDITNFKTPSPWETFYAREALGTKTWDVYDDVMGAFSGEMDYLLAVGGDGELKPREDKEVNRFKPVVKFLGPFYLEKGKTRSHKITMPQYIGSVKTMVVAAADGAYGSADKVTPVKQPLMVMATLPRVMGPGETASLPVNVFVLDKKLTSAQITVEAQGNLALTGSKSQRVSFNGEGDKVIFFDVTAKESIGPGRVKVTATSGSMTATYDIELAVMPRNPMTTAITDQVVAGGATWNHSYKPIGMLGENGGTIEVSSMPPLNLEKRLGYLIRYPHGCIEQTTSSVFSQLYLSKLINLDDDRKDDVQRNIKAAVERLKSFQLPSGGFAYWPGNAQPNNWGSNYAGHFLLEAQKAGYLISESMIASWINFQTQKADNWGALSTDDENDLVQAYRLYTLALGNAPALGAMNRMKENDRISREAKWRLALAYAVAGYDNQAKTLVEDLSTSIDSASRRHYQRTFGSQLRDKAMILETVQHLGDQTKSFEMVMDIAREMADADRWMSTQTTAYCLISLAKYAENFKLEEGTNVTMEIGGQRHKIDSYDFVNQVVMGQPDKEASVNITNEGSAAVFVRVIRTGIPLEGNEPKLDRNIKLDIRYTDMSGNAVNINALPQGTNFKSIVTVTNPGMMGAYTELALTQLFPSGWEIINTRLDGSAATSKADYMDIRDDRVMHYFDLQPNKSVTFEVLLNASYQGKFYLPSVSVEAMYNNSIFANKPGMWVNVVK